MTNYNDFIHPSDKKALDALKALPGFDFVVKKFMSIYSEKINKLETTSSMIRLSEKQLPHIYNILLKVCRKLEISVPELYLKLDREPNAYTMGDSEIFIVIHSGLLETLTLDQVETVIAHECGHILCHHNLYTTMCVYIMRGAEHFIGGPISNAIFTAVQYAFFYWMRCSEFSADRVSAYYHGTAEPVIDVMMALAGATSNLNLEFSREEFFKQAIEYKRLVDDSKYNKALEFITFGLNSHPLIAYRAYEINEFYKKFTNKLTFNSGEDNSNLLLDNNQEYTLRIKFEYIKPKAFFGLGGMLDAISLEAKIEKKKHILEKNAIKEIVLPSGQKELIFKVGVKKLTYTHNLVYDTCLVVSWNSDEQKISVREEI